MTELGIFVYCAATGFAAAATISSFYQWVTSEPADFAIARSGFPGMALAVLITMFCGPFIVLNKVAARLRTREIRALPAALGFVVAGMWSVCAGVFYISLLIAA